MLTFEEWEKLNEEEKEKRFAELSKSDQTKWRLTCPLGGKVVGHSIVTEEEKKRGTIGNARTMISVFQKRKPTEITEKEILQFIKDTKGFEKDLYLFEKEFNKYNI